MESSALITVLDPTCPYKNVTSSSYLIGLILKLFGCIFQRLSEFKAALEEELQRAGLSDPSLSFKTVLGSQGLTVKLRSLLHCDLAREALFHDKYLKQDS